MVSCHSCDCVMLDGTVEFKIGSLYPDGLEIITRAFKRRDISVAGDGSQRYLIDVYSFHKNQV